MALRGRWAVILPSRFALLLCCAVFPGGTPAVPAPTPRHTHTPCCKPRLVSSCGAAMRLAGSAVFSSLPDPSDPAKTAQSGPAGPGPQGRSTGPARPGPRGASAAGPAGETCLRVGPSGSGCGGLLIPAGGAAGSPGTAALHTRHRRRCGATHATPPAAAAVAALRGGVGRLRRSRCGPRPPFRPFGRACCGFAGEGGAFGRLGSRRLRRKPPPAPTYAAAGS